MIFGLTGGVATGKSTVEKTFIKHGIQIVDADIIARQVVVPGTPGLSQIVETFGHTYLQADGTLDRVKFGNMVFADPASMDTLNHIMGPLIEAEAAVQLNKLQEAGHPLICYSAALIIEMNHADLYRPLVATWCPQEMQIERLMSRNSLTRPEAMNRIGSQMSAELKAHTADYVINTWGTIEYSVLQTEIFIKHLKEML